MLHLRRLSYFAAVLEHGTLMAASEALRVAQPALSRQIRLLEEELELPLFERRRGRLVPTPTGLALGGIARALLEQADRAERAARSLRAGTAQHLVCVTTRSTNQGLFSPFIATLGASMPLLTTTEVEHVDVERALSHGADLAIAPLPPSPHLASRAIADFPVLAHVSLRHPWALESRDHVTLAELVEEHLILPPESSISRQELDRALRRERLAPRTVLESTVDSTSLALAASDRGVAVLTSDSGPGVRSIPIRTAGEQPRITLYGCWMRDHYAADAIAELVDAFAAYVESRYGALADSDARLL
ncbi:DNA-binding transcriptional regulator, LysR family [Agrococcus baldri]|uniref:DNA-binding transcriptional regulator, LysR family n=1 Tax=Agrococcus baldri TaxID=153730 RepID=A0AA94KZ25_9MICO|nr:LysR family transcriptional regulator [Agrococcus baldri]SFS04074.1 DNA-binding transcriptional regulator, LysR family [Agrococcus baldri]